MTCKCSRWTRRRESKVTDAVFLYKECGPVAVNGKRRVAALITGSFRSGWFSPMTFVLNQQGAVSSTVSGRPESSLARAKHSAEETLADECRMRGFEGRRR